MRARSGRIFLGVFSLTLLWLVAANPATASVARSMSLDELVTHSTNIVTARCLSTSVRWNADRTRIVTVARYAIADDLKGDIAGEIEVETLGGEIGEIGMYVPGMPTFQAGADDLLFLSNRRSASFEVVGMAQGQFHITFANQSTPPIVERSLDGVELVGPRDSRLDRQRLATFVRAIRLAIN